MISLRPLVLVLVLACLVASLPACSASGEVDGGGAGSAGEGASNPDCPLVAGASACQWLEERLERCLTTGGAYGTVFTTRPQEEGGPSCASTAVEGRRGAGPARVIAERASDQEVVATAEVIEGAFSLPLPPGRYVVRYDYGVRPSVALEIVGAERHHLAFEARSVAVGSAVEVFDPRLDPQKPYCALADGNSRPEEQGCVRIWYRLPTCLTFDTGIYGVAKVSYGGSLPTCLSRYTLATPEGPARIVAVRESDGRRWDAGFVDGIFALPLPPDRYQISFLSGLHQADDAPVPSIVIDLVAGERRRFEASVVGAYGNLYGAFKAVP